MTGALVACWDCGFVTRRHGAVGARGECPHCRKQLSPISFSATRKLQIRRKERERARGTRPILSPPQNDTTDRYWR
ncbi:MAG: hypothetical protein QOE75_1836 [Solirubrobacterales bacterium]|jgi:hypothetical protein|nr:hypothetical protein [Solirubrobacterales bacterium]